LYLNDFYNFSQPEVSNDTIYFGSVSGQVYAVNTNTMQGEKIFSTPESLASYAALVKEEGGVKTFIPMVKTITMILLLKIYREC